MFCDQTSHTVAKAIRDSQRGNTNVQHDGRPGVTSTLHRQAEASVTLTATVREDFTRPALDDFALAYAYVHHVVKSGSSTQASSDEGVVACMRAL